MYDVIVIGAGAAGLMAAGVAARSGKSVMLIEKMEKAGRKIRITGKGRCNLTNVKPREEFLSKVRTNVEFFEPSYDDFDNQATIDFFREIGVELTVERGDRVFPTSEKAWEIADSLVLWNTRMGVETEYYCTVENIRLLGTRVCGVQIKNRRGFVRNIESEKVILCTGGVTYPSTGSTGDGYRFAYESGHRIEEVRPSLVPLVSSHPKIKDLTDLALKNVNAKLMVDDVCVKEEFGELEFTDRGVEGAIILRLSRDAVDAVIEEKDVKIVLDLKAALNEQIITERIKRETEALPPIARFSELLRKLMPKQLVDVIAAEISVPPTTQLRIVTEKQIEDLIRTIKNFTLPIVDYRPFEEAVVTAGGICTEDVDPTTLGSKHVRGLYFAGEVLDLDADTGGYNLQIAFSTGHLAGQLK